MAEAAVRDPALARDVLRANQRLASSGLATLTWGNVSGIDRAAGVYLIKPSGVPYDRLTADMMVPVELATGRVLDGDLRPSVDSETHRLLYQAHEGIGGITHTHSTCAVAFAQARRDIPVLGTTHADILELVEGDPDAVPAALVASHGPFTWGATPDKSVDHGIVCEAVADMALRTLALDPAAAPPEHLVRRHYSRKHGPGAYYGNAGPR
jgi:L-ribulose-5-phosphate 4-epimerase